MRRFLLLPLALTLVLTFGAAAPAQTASDIGRQFAPTGKLRIGVLMLSYFAVELVKAGQADAFSHVVPMLATALPALPGARILPGSYYNVPIAIGYPKGASAAVADYAKTFVADMKASGFAQKAIDRMGQKADGVVVEK